MAQAPPDPEFTIPGSPEKRADEHVDRLIEQSRSDYARMKDMDTQELLDQRGWMKTVIWNQRMGRRLDRSDQLTADMVSDDPAVVKRARATLVRRWRKIERDRGTARPEFVGQVQDAVAEAHRNPAISGFANAHPVHIQAAATSQPGQIAPQAEYDPGTKRITVYDQHAEGGSGIETLGHGDVTADEVTKPDITTASHGRDVAVYRHEFGHFVQDTLGDDPRVHEFQAEWEKYRAEYEQALASADTYAERKQITSDLLSFYSTTNWREGFAEAWTITSSPGFTDDHINNDRYSPSAQRMLRLTQEIARDYAPATADRGRERDGGAGAGGEPDSGGAGVGIDTGAPDRLNGPVSESADTTKPYSVITQHGANREERRRHFDTYGDAYRWAEANNPDTDGSMVPNIDPEYGEHPNYEKGMFWPESGENRYAAIHQNRDRPITDQEYETHIEPTAEENWRDAHGGRDPRANDADWEEFQRWARVLREDYDQGVYPADWR